MFPPIKIIINSCEECPYHTEEEFFGKTHQNCNKSNYIESSDDENILFENCPFRDEE